MSSSDNINPVDATNQINTFISFLQKKKNYVSLNKNGDLFFYNLIDTKVSTEKKYQLTHVFVSNAITEIILPVYENNINTVIGNGIDQVYFFAPDNLYDSNNQTELSYNNKITKITIEDGIEYISDNAFNADNKINVLEIINKKTTTNTLVNVDNFKYVNVKIISLPDTIISIGKGAFAMCHSLSDINWPVSIQSIGEGAFAMCYSLKKITLPNTIKFIGKGAFKECKSLSGITLPNTIRSIEDDTFNNCSSLSKIILPDTIISIGKGAFYGCHSLSDINLPNSIEYIGTDAFGKCYSLNIMSQILSKILEKEHLMIISFLNILQPK